MKSQQADGHERHHYKGLASLFARLGRLRMNFSGARSKTNLWVALVLLWAAAANDVAASDRLRVEPLASPAAEDSLTPFLAGSDEGLHMTWLEKTAEGHRLRYARWNGERFSDPSTVHASDRFFANWADFSSVLPFGPSGNPRLAAHWLEKSGTGAYDYDVFVSISDDGGKTWSPGTKPYRESSMGEHGFVSLARDGDGFRAVWLAPGERDMTLMESGFDGSSLSEETLVDSRVCDCCQTAMAAVEGGFFVAYRDRSDVEIRDIARVRFVSGRWSEPETVVSDGWHLTGCPVNGPQAAAEGNRLALAWFTASKDEPRVQVVFSTDGGETFGAPIRVDSGGALGRVDVELAGPDAVVTWLGRAARGGEILGRRLSPTGGGAESVVIAATGADRQSGFPRIAFYDGAIYVAWTESSSRQGPSRVQLARLALE